MSQKESRSNLFKAKIVAVLKHKGLTYNDLAERLNTSHANVANWFRKDRITNLKTIENIENVLDVDLFGLGWKPSEEEKSLSSLFAEQTVPTQSKKKQPTSEKDLKKKAIREYMKEKRYTYKQVADIIGTTQSALSYSLSYGSTVTDKKLDSIMEAITPGIPNTTAKLNTKKPQLIIPVEGVRKFGQKQLI
jgi:transcriptional regulator with XRE-family HTH domain